MSGKATETKNILEDAIRPQTLEKKAATKNSLLRLFFVAVIVLIQVMFFAYFLFLFRQKYTWIAASLRVFALFLVLGIYSQDKTPSMKMPWILLIVLSPIAGSLLYLMVGLSGSTWRMRRRYTKEDNKLFPILKQKRSKIEEAAVLSPPAASTMNYIEKIACFPAYDDSDIEFFPDAAAALEEQLKELSRAEKFIFMEYHAIEDKESFAPIKDILAEKAAEGVDVRVFYDDMGSIAFINGEFIKIMKDLGIKCRVFNPVTPLVNFFLNNRDHRKITVIDGRVGFTGGYNLANEYFGLTRPYGHWKDTGVKITGNAVRSLTALFLEMWNAIRDEDRDDPDYSIFFPDLDYVQQEPGTFIQPYGDSPLDNQPVGENVYMSIANMSTKYAWFATPYLIITDEMNRALCFAAERGVDVRIITPGIPDKRTVYSVTRSYYQRLVQHGVRIYEYSPGFIHAKQCVADDMVATCGTINLDYRSLYHHFENGCLFYNCEAVKDMHDDFAEMFPQCREVTSDYIKIRGAFRVLWYHIIRFISPLL